MISCKSLGNRGRLGNGLFQIAFIYSLAKKHNLQFALPQWPYAQYFEKPITSDLKADEIPHDEKLAEDHFHFVPEFWDQYADEFRSRNYDIICWGQSEKYFEHYKDDIFKIFTFKESFRKEVVSKMPVGTFSRSTIAISVRRGDYVDNPNYELMPVKYYLLALFDYFPTFREDYNIVLFSDDINYCKLHFECLENVYYAGHLSDIEQLCLGSMCDNSIMANSTFSWWLSWLIEYQKPQATVVRPNFLFSGPLLKKSDSRDFYPDRWKIIDHKIRRIDLTNVTFTIPVYYDSKDRKENVDLSIKYLRDNFDTNIMVGEQGRERFRYLGEITSYRFFDDMELFHRTKMLNDMAADCRTPIVVNWDADVIVPPLQIVEAAMAITKDKKDVVYPYDGRFARVPRSYLRTLDVRTDVGALAGLSFQGMKPSDAKSVGGAIFWKAESFIRIGLENENMISYGPEDAERFDRAMKLGLKVHRVSGVLYHLDHMQSINSGIRHPKFSDNVREMEKIRSMSREQLEAYVQSWPWAIKYTPMYYESIFEESVKSRDAIFSILEEYGILKPGMKIIDVGCALGSWGSESKYDYTGVDFGVPPDKLVISQEKYVDHDLRIPLTLDHKFDLAICMEVAEHITEDKADVLIDSLIGLSDTILFSAAIPGQGGVNHLNEQWQSWWAEKFFNMGYRVNDFRPSILNKDDIGLWYRQNVLLYTKDYRIDEMIGLHDYDFVHPQMYMNLMKHYRILR